METSRQSIVVAVERMSAAVGVISDVMRTAGRSEVFRAQRERIDGGIRALRDLAPALAEGIRTALAEVADGWKEIDGNKVRMNEVKRLLENYREFRMYVQDFDDWRCDCYEGIDIYPAAHEIAMSLVLLCRSCDRSVEGIVEALEKGADGGGSQPSPTDEFEREMSAFCSIPSSGYLVMQIMHPSEQAFRAMWYGKKIELSYFAQYYNLTSQQVRMIFEFPQERRTKTPFAYTRYPSENLPDDDPLVVLLKKYPRSILVK